MATITELRTIAAVKALVYSSDDHQQGFPAVLNNNDKWSNRNPIRGASWLALVSLAWLQLTLASHQFDHVAEYFADSCHVCVQLDRIDDSVVDVPMVSIPVQTSRSEPAPVYRGEFQPHAARPYSSRAPPLL